MSRQAEASLNSSKKETERHVSLQGITGGGSEFPVQDQIIIAPEIMSMILEHLNIQDLTTVRLVCKSWLREARVHMERRGVVRFCSFRDRCPIQEFLTVCQEKIPALPQPFQSIYVHFHDEKKPVPRVEQIFSQLSSVCPPLVITRFLPGVTPMKLAFPLIVQCSPNLIFLELMSCSAEASYLPPMDPEQNFPKLQHLEVEMAFNDTLPGAANNDWIHFPSLIAWIVKASTDLQTYVADSEADDEGVEELTSAVLLQVKIQNIKTLSLLDQKLNIAASEHFLSIPFSQLQNLTFGVKSVAPYSWSPQALLASVVAKCVNTLTTLDLSFMDFPELNAPAAIEFPVCANVQELYLFSFPYWSNFVSQHFPALQTLNIREIDVSHLEQDWSYVSPLLSIKTLRVEEILVVFSNSGYESAVKHSVKLFDKFPGVERLYMDSRFLMRFCMKKESGDPRYSNLLRGVRHLELSGDCFEYPADVELDGYSSLGVLKGIEKITLTAYTSEISTIPVKKLPCLKMIQFPWDEGLTAKKLLRISRRVEKLVVTNCCSITNTEESPNSKEMLKSFFESLPNAQCGCWGWVKSEKIPNYFTKVA